MAAAHRHETHAQRLVQLAEAAHAAQCKLQSLDARKAALLQASGQAHHTAREAVQAATIAAAQPLDAERYAYLHWLSVSLAACSWSYLGWP
jgi:hypothetical protein